MARRSSSSGGRGRRLYRGAYGQGRRGCDLHRQVARACRKNEKRRADDHAPPGRGAVHRTAARAASDRGAASRERGAGRHRLRLHEILRHGMGGVDDPAISGAGRLCRVAAELHERGDDRRRRRLGQDDGLHRQQHQRRSRRTGPCPSRRAQGRRGAHGLSLRRDTRARSPSGRRRSAGSCRCRQRQGRPTICGASAGRSW